MRVVGIDPSLTGTCMFDGDVYLKVSPKMKPMAERAPGDDMDRMRAIRDAVLQFVGEGERAGLVMVEDFAFSRAEHAHDKGGLGWLIRVALHEAGYEVGMMKPNLRAKLATGKGNAKKDLVVSATSARTGMTFASDDHCDAYLLWVAGSEMVGESHTMGTLPRAHLEALDKVVVIPSDSR